MDALSPFLSVGPPRAWQTSAIVSTKSRNPSPRRPLSRGHARPEFEECGIPLLEPAMAAHLPSDNPYPSTDPGFAALQVEELLASNDDLIGRIRLCFGIDRDTFERDVQVLLRRYAACVHLLPATADNYFSTPGGLLRLGLEVAFFSLQGTDAHIFAGRSTISVRRQLEPRWRMPRSSPGCAASCTACSATSS